MKNDYESIFSEARKLTQKDMLGDSPAPKELEIVEGTSRHWKTIIGNKPKSKIQDAFKDKSEKIWNNKDLVEYFAHLFFQKTGAEVETTVATSVGSLKRMKDCFTILTGRNPTTSETRKYLEWFIDERLTFLLSKYNRFKTSYWYYEKNVQDFIETALNVEKVKTETGLDSNVKDAKFFTSSMMYAICKADRENFVKRYGIVLSTVWLIKKEGMSEAEAVREVSDIVVKFTEISGFDAIMKSTLRNNPYPTWCNFQSLEAMLVDLTNRTGEFFTLISPQFMKDCRNFSFLADTGV